jgi:8-oxo-dGTP diphosphatase
LIRELQEELGITVTACSPWLTREFIYPHAHVRIHFWRVTAWDGEIGITAPLEHAAVDWLKCGEMATVAPILPANDPILKALSLPTQMAITMAESEGVERQLERLEEGLARGLRLIQVREKTWPAAERLWFADSVTLLAENVRALVLINDDQDIAQRVEAAGVHLSAASLLRCEKRPAFEWVGASCHNAEELAKAMALELDYALLGPVLPTQTHPDAAAMGWQVFEQLRENCTIPVFALGGMRPEMLAEAQQHGAHGLAFMRGW